MHTKLWSENLKRRGLLEDLGLDGSINISMDPKEPVGKDVECMHLAQDRDQRRAVMNTVINLRVL
jgi:hypothetical protein